MIDFRSPPIEQQVTLLARTLPDGRVWRSKYDRTRVLGRLVAALAEEIARSFSRISDFVLKELDPKKTRQLILEWEESVGIPDDCFDRSADLDERRRRVVQKLNNFGGIITRADLEGVLLDFGEAIKIVPGSADNAELLGFPAPPYDTNQLKQIKHTIAVRVASDAPAFPLPFPIEFASELSGLLQCLVRRITPANVAIQFFFNEDLGTPFGGFPPELAGTNIAPFVADTVVLDAGELAGTNEAPFVEDTIVAEATPTFTGTNVAPFVEDAIVLGGFEPTDIANLQLELDASDSGSITETSGEASQWDDGSTEGNDVTQGTAANQPNTSTINGNDSLFFDGTNDRLRDSSPTITSPPATIAVVFTPTSVAAGNGDCVRIRSGSAAVFRVRRNGDDLEALEGTGGSTTTMAIANVLAANETRWVIARFRNSGDGTSDMLTDEDDTDSASLAASISNVDDINIAANANGADAFAGHIHQVIYYNRFITDTERTDLGAYLSSKWSLS